MAKWHGFLSRQTPRGAPMHRSRRGAGPFVLRRYTSIRTCIRAGGDMKAPRGKREHGGPAAGVRPDGGPRPGWSVAQGPC